MEKPVKHAGRSQRCTVPALGELLTPFCFGDLDPRARNTFVAHIADCPACATEVQHLSKAVELLRNDRELNQVVLSGSLPSVLGLSDRFDEWLGGHRWFVLVWSLMYGVLFGLALIAEVSYSYDRFGDMSVAIAGPLALWIALTTVVAAWVDWKRVRRARSDGLVWSVGILSAATLAAIAVLWIVLPNETAVFARFETHPMHAGINKFVAYNVPMALASFIVPIHFVMSIQHELRSSRRSLACQQIEQGRGLLPRGCFYPPPLFLGALFLGLVAHGYLGATYLFDNLLPGPHRNFFIAMVQARIGWYLVTALAALSWYAYAVNELRRECAGWRAVGGL